MRAITGLLLVAVIALAALNVWQASRGPAERSEQEIIDEFHELWALHGDTWVENKWLGIPALQNPFDVWITQEIITEVKPDVIVEAGTYRGGSAALWAMVLAQVNPDGRVITIDIDNRFGESRRIPIVRERVEFLLGSSTSPEIVQQVEERVAGKKMLMILDSNHARDHVLAELRAYQHLITTGSYFIVQDGSVNGHPVAPEHGPGPYEAVEAFLAENADFVADRKRERLLITSNPMGFLRRVRRTESPAG